MKYLEVTVSIDENGVEPLLAMLDTVGIDNAEVIDPRDAEEIMADKETYEWDYVDEKVTENLGARPLIKVYHDSVTDEEDREFVALIRETTERLEKDAEEGIFGEGVNFGTIEVTSEVKDDSLWKDKWKEYFKPTHITDRIVVKPTWEGYDSKDDEIVIEIDPGMAFGTGTHETTSMCMKAMEKYVKPGMKVLDAGCGSGILSIAAAKLDAGDVLGVDIDEEAVRVSGENFELNKTQDVCNAEVGDVTKGVNYTADLIVANLMAELLCMISGGIAAHLEARGTFISSGILNEKEEMVRKAYDEAGLSVIEAIHDGEWCCIIAEKK